MPPQALPSETPDKRPTCARCSTQFTPKRYWQKFCSNHCMAMAQKERYARMKRLLDEDEKRNGPTPMTRAATLDELAE